MILHRDDGKSITGGAHIHIFVLCPIIITFETEIWILKSIVFTVCEQEYMNMAAPIIDFPASLILQVTTSTNVAYE